MGNNSRLHTVDCNCADCWWWPIEDKIRVENLDDEDRGSFLGPLFVFGPVCYIVAYIAYCYLF